MDVDKVSFYPLILDLLTDISEAHFVAVDLELSGVPSKPIGRRGRQTLQQRYLETKEAADRYQILQIGLTICERDSTNGKYILKPYNFDLSPLIDERGLDVERIFSFQSGAAEFLLKVGFDLGKPFQSGVPYLSRTESKEARDSFAKRQDKTAVADIQIKPTETESLAFLERVRNVVNAWLDPRVADKPDYVNITAVGAELVTDDEIPEELSRFEKRLVHQLVRAEYPELVSFSKRGFVQIVRFDKEREDKIAADRKRELTERINRQKGFRWIVEALLGNDITNLDLRECAKDSVTGEHIFADMDEYRAQFHRAQARLRRNPKMIVGHNCFLDLIYIYRTFIGKLPDTVIEFQQKLHALWPRIVDTKYMSTHNCGDISPVSSLEQIAAQLSDQEKPVIEVDKQHGKYENTEAFHEAGYDSFLTAQIAVRLSSKLEKEGAYVDIDHAPANGVVNGIADVKLTEETSTADDHGKDNGTANTIPEPEGFTPSEVGGKWRRKGDPTVRATNGPDDPFTVDPTDLTHRHRDLEPEQTIDGGMPRLSSDFWRVYGNKLRVFGTEESVCMLDDPPKEAMSDQDGEGQGGVEVR